LSYSTKALKTDVNGKPASQYFSVALDDYVPNDAPASEAKQTALEALIGEVQASPTENTVLERLKAIEDKLISGIPLSGSNLKGANVASVTTAGTRVQLPTLSCSKVTIIAKRANTGYIYVGMNTVSSTVYAVELSAKDSMDFGVNNLNELWIDSSVNGEGISYAVI